MNKNIKLKLTIAITILIMFICVISAGLVIAQSNKGATGDKKPAEVAPPSASSGPGAATPVATPAAPAPKVDVPQKTSKVFGQTGRPDPFIIVTGTPTKMTFSPTATGQVRPGQGSTEGAAGGAVLTGTFIVNGNKYALIKFGDQTKICKEGMQIMGFSVAKISSKKVTLVGKTGKVELKIEDYSTKNQAPNNMQAPSSFGGDNKSLVPPPMQVPTQTQPESPGASSAPATQQGAAESPQQGSTK